MSDLVGNPEDRFSCVAAYLVLYGEGKPGDPGNFFLP